MTCFLSLFDCCLWKEKEVNPIVYPERKKLVKTQVNKG